VHIEDRKSSVGTTVDAVDWDSVMEDKHLGGQLKNVQLAAKDNSKTAHIK
jgi:hypothetical protein